MIAPFDIKNGPQQPSLSLTLWMSQTSKTKQENPPDDLRTQLMLVQEMEGSERQSSVTTTNRASLKVLVAVKAERVISKSALAWALTHVVHPGDSITLLAVFSMEKTSKASIIS